MKIFPFVLTLCVNLPGAGFSSETPVVAAYYENWSQYRPPSGGRAVFFPNLIDPTILTDLYYAFAVFGFVTASIDQENPHLTGDYTVQPVEWNDESVLYPQVMDLKQINPNLRNILSIGGWSFNDPTDKMGEYTYKLFSQMVGEESNRAQFIDSAISYAQRYGFQGIDIDWEYPGDQSRGGTPDDFANFITFLQEAYTACHAANPPLLLTYASPAIVPSGVPESYQDDPASYFAWLAEASKYLDRLNVMAYDYHGSFDNPQLTGVNAPLNQDTDPKSQMFLAATLQNYLQNGVPANKIVLGMPTYGHSYGGVASLTSADSGPGKPFTSPGAAGPSTGALGTLAYFEVADMTATNTLVFASDVATQTAYGYNTATQEWVSFDTPDTIALKVGLALDKAILGCMFWAVDDDEYQWGEKYPNIRKGYTLFYPAD
ncbi:MAG: glycosyl hydrolase family 18 protein [Chlamydiota bacterium]